MSKPAAEPDASMPEGIGYAYRFQLYNSLSFSLIIGTPILLFFKKLDASVTVLGIVAALPALLNIMQIPAARYVERVGYREFVLKGWTIRSVFILLAAGVAILPEQFNPATRMILMLVLLFLYNLSRGIAVCGFLPWMTQLVPESQRGNYLSRDQLCGFSAVTLGSLFCGFYLKAHHSLGAFGVIFMISFLAAMVSLYYLKRMPDVEIAESSKSASREPVPWKRMLTYTPFTRMLIFNVVMLLGWTGNGVMVIPMLRDQYAVSDSMFMYLNAAWGVVFIIGLLTFGKVSDWAGSKPVVSLSLVFQAIHFTGWGLVAAGVLPFTLGTLVLQQTTWGIAFALFSVANMRLLMGIVPELGRSHFFALFSVGTSLTAGLAPVGWGLAADTLKNLHLTLGPFELNGYSSLYLLVVCCIGGAAVCLRRVEEAKALTGKAFFKELVERTPARAVPRLFHRRMWP